MKATLALLLLAAAFAAGVLYLFGVEFATGDVYPEYSSLRADPMGTRLLYESLARLPGIATSRNYLPLETLRENDATLLMLALDPKSFSEDSADSATLESIEQFARRGNRVVAAMALKSESEPGRGDELAHRWNVRLAIDSDRKHVHKLYFAEAADWNVLDRVGPKTMAVERDFGQGSVVLFAESDDFANDSTIAADRLEMVTAALGSDPHIVFDERHLGIAESGSIVGLARRFRLTGMAFGLALCAALFIWRSASAFPPPAAAPGAVRLSGRTAHAGLLTLLRRHIPPAELVAACWQQWLALNRRTLTPERLGQAAAIAAKSKTPLEAVRQMQAVLTSERSEPPIPNPQPPIPNPRLQGAP
jgi:hypothetical protein